jgi:hypothetical protein
MAELRSEGKPASKVCSEHEEPRFEGWVIFFWSYMILSAISLMSELKTTTALLCRTLFLFVL